MNSYELYNRVLSAMNEDEGTFNACARNWIESGKDPNFKNDEANELFYTAKLACAAWRNKAINGRVSKGRMIDCVRKIAEMKLDNPYDPNEKVEEPKIEEIKLEKTDEPKMHVLGVIPEEMKELNKVDADGSIGGWSINSEESQEEPKEEKRFFGKRKK